MRRRAKMPGDSQPHEARQLKPSKLYKPKIEAPKELTDSQIRFQLLELD